MAQFDNILRAFISWLLFTCINSKCLNSHSQYNEENTLIETLFKGIREKTYVEIGALNGRKYSNTLRLHTCYDWNGLLVEGNPMNYAKLESVTRSIRPNAKTKFGAVCAPPQNTTKFLLNRNPILNAVSGDLDHMEESFRKKWLKHSLAPVEVPCKPMSEYLSGMSSVQFFSLDVEGSELIVLETIDFRAVTIDVFLIEFDGWNRKKEFLIRRYLQNLDYEECVHAKIKNSALFLRNSARPTFNCTG
jgi:hypothetical protein